MATSHFVIAGAQRSGTTYLWHRLDGHAEIEMARPVRPEPKYFLDEVAWRRGPLAYRSQLFPGSAGDRLLGEKSTSYIERPEVAARIQAILPEARIVFVLRDPVERAVSNYWFSVDHGIETLPMEEAFEREEARRATYDRSRFSVSPFAYRARGLYDELLAPWEEAFPGGQVALVLFERLVRDGAELRRLLRFLGVSEPADMEPVPGRNHSSGRRGEPSPALRRDLAAGFRSSSLALAHRHGLDLSCWPSVALATSSAPGRS